MKVGSEPEGVAVRPDNKVIYVTCETSNLVDAIDAATHEIVGRIPTGPRPRGIALTPDQRMSVESLGRAKALVEIDPLGGSPWGVALAGQQ